MVSCQQHNRIKGKFDILNNFFVYFRKGNDEEMAYAQARLSTFYQNKTFGNTNVKLYNIAIIVNTAPTYMIELNNSFMYYIL